MNVQCDDKTCVLSAVSVSGGDERKTIPPVRIIRAGDGGDGLPSPVPGGGVPAGSAAGDGDPGHQRTGDVREGDVRAGHAAASRSRSLAAEAGDPDPASCRLRKAQSGDKDALAALVADYLPLLYRAARRMPAREREDAVAEGRLGLIRAIRAYDPASGLELPGYLKIRVNYIMYNYMRRYHHEADHTVAEADILDRADAIQAARSDPADGPAVLLLRRHDEERLRAAMTVLTSRERACLKALFWEGKSYVQTAEAMGVSEGFVSVIRGRALQKLKRKLA